jgi:sulfoxide reductase heme-binding subunit YedZ
MVTTFHVYIFAVLFSIVFLIVAAVISNAIKYEGGANPKDPGKRKMWFWVMGVLGTFTNFLFGFFNYYYPEGSNFAKNKLIIAIGIATLISFVIYIMLGFVLSKFFKNGKLGNWF